MAKTNDAKPRKKSTSSPAKHKSPGGGRDSSGGAKMKILNAAAATKLSLGEDLDRKQIPALTGITGASTIRNALAALKKNGWIEVTAETVVLTSEGMDRANPGDLEVPSSNAEHHEKIKTQRKLTPKAIAVFDMLVDGRVYSKQDVANAIFDGKMNSTFRNTLADLSKHKIIERPDSSSLRLTDKMFPFIPRPE